MKSHCALSTARLAHCGQVLFSVTLSDIPCAEQLWLTLPSLMNFHVLTTEIHVLRLK